MAKKNKDLGVDGIMIEKRVLVSSVHKADCVSVEEYEELKKENETLKEELHILSNTKLVKELKEAMKRIESGKFLSKEEFFKDL